MTSELVKSVKAMGDLCHILNRNRGIRQSTNFVKETDAGVCPHCGMKMVEHIVEEGARYHVHSYNSYRDKSRSPVHCSDPHCVDNNGIGRCVDKDGELYK